MTKQFLLASAALALATISSTPATAAGQWSGFYIGGHAGGLWGDIDTTHVSNNVDFYNFAAGSTFDFSPSGVLGGAQLGYNFQMSSFVFGIELSGSASDLDETQLHGWDDVETAESDWNASASARAGFAWQNSLLYIKGGYAVADIQHSVADDSGVERGTFSSSENHGGYTVGGGFEHMLSPDVSFGLEYNFISLEEDQHSTIDNELEPVVHDIEATLHTVTARLNWHWNPSF